MTDGDGSPSAGDDAPAGSGETTDEPENGSTGTESPADEELPEGWTVWNDEPGGRRVLAYRPDVFDTQQFPPACLPTLFVAAGPPNRPAAETEYGPTEVWRVQFFLEPDVELLPARTYDARADALAAARELAGEFARGELNYREAYQVPREEYLDRLDELTGD